MHRFALCFAAPCPALLDLLAAPAVSQNGSGAPPKAQPAAPRTQAVPERTAKSKECSAQADQKGLHGKARKRFRSSCKRS
jgi:hypothetical protein